MITEIDYLISEQFAINLQSQLLTARLIEVQQAFKTVETRRYTQQAFKIKNELDFFQFNQTFPL